MGKARAMRGRWSAIAVVILLGMGLCIIAFTLVHLPASKPRLLAWRGRSVLVVDGEASLFGGPDCTFTYSVDGKHPTQYCGAPAGMAHEMPSAVSWIDDTHALITYPHGRRYQLTLDAQLVKEAKASPTTLHDVAPQFNITP